MVGTSYTVALRRDVVEELRTRDGLTVAELAARMGVAATTVSRVLSGRHAPGVAFIAGALTAFPGVRFEELFDLVAVRRIAEPVGRPGVAA